MKHPNEDDFEVHVEEGAVEVTFEPTKSYYYFAMRSDPDEIEEFGPLSPPSVRHANPQGDTGDYSPREVATMASSLAMKVHTLIQDGSNLGQRSGGPAPACSDDQQDAARRRARRRADRL
jgi:hypothetical protein